MRRFAPVHDEPKACFLSEGGGRGPPSLPGRKACKIDWKGEQGLFQAVLRARVSYAASKVVEEVTATAYIDELFLYSRVEGPIH
jgi:hypothetical protein